MSENKKNSIFTRILIVIFSISLALMVGYSFVCVTPGVISTNSLIIIFLILILVLSEAFDKFSLGKLFSMEKALSKSKEENKKLESVNNQLINQIISLTKISQKQSNTNIFGDVFSERGKAQRVIDTERNVEELLNRVENSIVITDIENSIIAELNKKDLVVESKTEKILLRHLAGTQLISYFQRVHQYIYGTQIEFLRALSVEVPDGYDLSKQEEFYNNVKLRYSKFYEKKELKFFLNYLFRNTLITEEEGKIHITNFGEEYLNWIDVNNITDKKFF